MTTVGYGDYYPTSELGKTIGVCCFYAGILFLALPIAVLSTNFQIIYDRHCEKKERRRSQSTTRSTSSSRTRSTARSVQAPPGQWLPHADSIRKSIFMVLEDPTACYLSQVLSVALLAIILVSTAAFIFESMPDYQYTPDDCSSTHLSVENCRPRPIEILHNVEVACIIIFTIDYLLRIGTVHSANPEDCGVMAASNRPPSESKIPPWKLTLLYACQGLNMIDLLAIIPFYVELAGYGGGGGAVIRVLRLVRVFRILKTPKLRACVDMFSNVMQDALPALVIVFLVKMLMCVLLASFIVFAESSDYSVDSKFVDYQYPYGLYVRPTMDGYAVEPSPFRSILFAFWWFFTTATTVGYGDDYPTTAGGRIVGVLTFYTGIILLALPVTIVGGSFNKYYPEWLKEFGGRSGEETGEEGGDTTSTVDLPSPVGTFDLEDPSSNTAKIAWG